jgi:hypothetical protein
VPFLSAQRRTDASLWRGLVRGMHELRSERATGTLPASRLDLLALAVQNPRTTYREKLDSGAIAKRLCTGLQIPDASGAHREITSA